jgi:ring-1,2-phenylacetyl-CoA epoxidase subunit PaaE
MSMLSAPPRRRHAFAPLTVTGVERLTDDAVAVTFAVPADHEGAADFLDFRPGQHLTLRARIDGEDVRQSYSLCLPRSRARATGSVRVAAARVPGGRMSNWLNDFVQVGDVIEVLPPLGSFTNPTEPGAAKHHVFVAAGSGITPVLSLIASVLEDEPRSRVTLFYGNRTTRHVMFLEELEDLKNAALDRFQMVHVLSREETDGPLFHGRIDGERLPRLLNAFAPVDGVDDWYLCGPNGLVEDARAFLADAGVDARHVHHEVFHVPSQEDERPRVVVDETAPPEAVVTVNLDGRTSRIEMPTREETILDATLRVRPDAPFSCTGGVCGTCRARVTSGEVRMDRNYALEPDEVAAGVVLACQSHPVTDEVHLDYDA